MQPFNLSYLKPTEEHPYLNILIMIAAISQDSRGG